MMNELLKLKKTLEENTDRRIPIAIVWAKADRVDWDSKTMTAVGISDNLPYYDVLLGLGNHYIRPQKGSKCLLGIIQNNNAAAFLISCEKSEAVEWYNDEQVIEMDGVKFSIRNQDESLHTLIADMLDAIIEEKHQTNMGVTISHTPDSALRFSQLKTRFNHLLKAN